MAVKPRDRSAAFASIDIRRLVRVPLDWTLHPASAALLVRTDAYPFSLIGRWAGGGAVIGSEPVRVAAEDEDPFALLDDQPSVAAGDHHGAVGGGWFGWLGYQLGRRLEAIDPSPPPVATLAPFQLAFYDHVLRLDAAGRWWFEALWSEERDDLLRHRLGELEQRAADPPAAKPFSTEAWRATPSAAGHGLAVGACRERIRAGDLFQANVCVRLDSRLSGDVIDLFAAAVRHMRPDRAAFVSSPARAVASLSPELFLERRERRVRSAPIKGTRPMPRDPALAAVARSELLASEKDRAENVMIVDLVRNDLGRVCVPGSVRVDALAEARAHAGVWHLVSEVSGTLGADVADSQLVRAAFPPGSVSGAPKIAAMNVVAELESSARELYTGAIGFASPLAGLELSVAIRSFEFAGKRAWLGVGGGVVADSDPVAETAECMIKAAPLLEAIGGRFGPAPLRALNAPAPGRLAPRPVPRPDPDAGVFETILVRCGRPVAVERHLRRLAASIAALYRAGLPAGIEQELFAAAAQLEAGRLRVDLRPGEGTARTDIAASPIPARESPVRLSPVSVAGGLGCHKWIDRRLLTALGDSIAGEPLLIDLDGLVLEAGRANVFAVERGPRLVTPPADGRILPGVSRAQVIELGRALGLDVREEPLGLGRLARAEEVFITGALRGVEPAMLDTGVLGLAPVTARLAHAWSASVPDPPTPAPETAALPV
jgi:anthranilate/para-aminobenzoate synthase component I/branched-subunit amino acid aminotransferase/4-amino-4-deoxychorismate lyase